MELVDVGIINRGCARGARGSQEPVTCQSTRSGCSFQTPDLAHPITSIFLHFKDFSVEEKEQDLTGLQRFCCQFRLCPPMREGGGMRAVNSVFQTSHTRVRGME